MSKRVNVKNSIFEQAVKATPDIETGFKQGLQAFGKHSTFIKLSNTYGCEGSVDIDNHTAKIYPDANRWDYIFAYNSLVYFVEVHPAETSDVDIVLSKLKWLKNWLVKNAPVINGLQSATSPYYWIKTGRFNIQPGSKQYRRAVQSGLKPVSALSL